MAHTNVTVPSNEMTVENTLPKHWKEEQAALVGRVWRPGLGPSVVRVNEDGTLTDITEAFPYVKRLCEEDDPAAALRAAKGENIGRLSDILANTSNPDPDKPYLLAPNDLQSVKAAGVTFVASLVERVVEEVAKGDPAHFEEKRQQIWENITQAWSEIRNDYPHEFSGAMDVEEQRKQQWKGIKEEVSRIKPNTPQALRLLDKLVNEIGLPKSYLMVGLGEDAEIFAKTDPLQTVVHGTRGGYNGKSNGTNPEPEVVTVINSKGKIVGAALGNDVNDRGREGKSLALLNRAKNLNGSTTIGGFIRLVDKKDFTLDHIRNMDVRLCVQDKDGKTLYDDVSHMTQISRDIEDLARQATERTYPNGVILYNGTMAIPTKRGSAEFTHERGDRVSISADKLGRLVNIMVPSTEITMGKEHDLEVLTSHLADRGALQSENLWKKRATWANREKPMEAHML